MNDSGYDGPGGEDRFVGTQIWKVLWRQSPGHPSILATVEVQEGEKRRVLGYLNCQDEAEFKWMKSRMEGDRRVE